MKDDLAGGREIIPLALTFAPILDDPKYAEARGTRNVAMLAVVESIRLYGAAHDGQLPERLEDITEVPIPLDPFRNEPFVYRRDGDTAYLESPNVTHIPRYGLRYHIRFAEPSAQPLGEGQSEDASGQ